MVTFQLIQKPTQSRLEEEIKKNHNLQLQMNKMTENYQKILDFLKLNPEMLNTYDSTEKEVNQDSTQQLQQTHDNDNGNDDDTDHMDIDL